MSDIERITSKYRKKQLQMFARDFGIPSTGNKKDLARRIIQSGGSFESIKQYAINAKSYISQMFTPSLSANNQELSNEDKNVINAINDHENAINDYKKAKLLYLKQSKKIDSLINEYENAKKKKNEGIENISNNYQKSIANIIAKLQNIISTDNQDLDQKTKLKQSSDKLSKADTDLVNKIKKKYG